MAVSEAEAKKKAIAKITRALGALNSAQAILLRVNERNPYLLTAQDMAMRAVERLEGTGGQG